ncbi:zinc-dependent metalloprotease [Nocardioides yefusunii]|uniref:Zinc-dependent metalloprotease n=1 Tax=Nocardioides yefusunii TaxID=2500546 RepID=A0ABW1QZN2_9ACTN|nr:zinc-dependent metalloprotease [Nocardioides yefusunii]
MNEMPGNSGPDDQNPFKGTPFEQFFSGAAGGAAGGFPGLPPGMDLNSLMAQVQKFMQPHDGPINWDNTLDIARHTAAQKPDPTPTNTQQNAVADAVRLADHWLDETTSFPSAVVTATAWSRAEWIVETADVWRKLVEPMAASASTGLAAALPEEMRAMAGPLIGMLSQASGAMVAQQVGSALGGLADEVWGATDVGIPLNASGKAALVVGNIEAFAAGLDVSSEDVLLYLALREAAHQRLFAHVPWLSEHLIGAVRDYATGIEIDTAGIEEKMRGLDMSDPAKMQEAFSGGLLNPEPSAKQRAALERLEVTLALVEGWVDEVVAQAATPRMPSAAKLQEAVRRRRASGGPAEQTFANLVGLELRPRRLRDASTLWGALRTRQGIEGRDGVWMHPDLLPTATDLDDPLGFREGSTTTEMSDEEFDAGLRDLLDGGPGDRPTEA